MTELCMMIFSPATQTQTSTPDSVQHCSEIDALDAALQDMTAAFSSDFASGLIGQRHNTFSHRTRVLRQMADDLALMRARDLLPLVQNIPE
jgi:hypothetical protein